MELDEKQLSLTTNAEPAATCEQEPSSTLSIAGNAQQDRQVLYLVLAFMLVLLSFWFLEAGLQSVLGNKVIAHSLEPTWSGLPAQLMQFIGLLWFFMLGGSFGSFLHCVEYRLPRGISVVAQGSRCPGCNTAIKAWHNVPVLGWLALRGRCAQCGWLIPVRYPLAELVFGCVFVILMASELITGGYFLPVRNFHAHFGIIELFLSPNWNLIGHYAHHTTLLTFLLTWCLFALDDHSVSPSLILLAICVGVIWGILWPYVYLVHYQGSWQNGLLPALALENGVTLCAGVGLGWLMGALFATRASIADNTSTHSGFILIGIWLGWQAVLGIALFTLVLRLLACITRLCWLPQICSMTFASLIYISFWKIWVSISYLTGSSITAVGMIFFPPVIMLFLLGLNAWENRIATTASKADLPMI